MPLPSQLISNCLLEWEVNCLGVCISLDDFYVSGGFNQRQMMRYGFTLIAFQLESPGFCHAIFICFEVEQDVANEFHVALHGIIITWKLEALHHSPLIALLNQTLRINRLDATS